MPEDQLKAFRGAYLETARQLKAQQGSGAQHENSVVQELDFEFVLFASAVIDYDYIMALITNYQGAPEQQQMSRDELIGLIAADAKFIDDVDDFKAYIYTLHAGQGWSEQRIRDGYLAFKDEQKTRQLRAIANSHGLAVEALQAFVDHIMARMIFDGEQLGDLLAPLGLGWKERSRKELTLMKDLLPLLQMLAQGREISGLQAYEQ